MHGRMPVVTPVKRRGELARRPRILIGLKHVRQLVRVFPVHAVECQPGKACRRRLVNLDRRWLHLDGLHCLRWRLEGHADHECDDDDAEPDHLSTAVPALSPSGARVAAGSALPPAHPPPVSPCQNIRALR